MKRHYMDDEYEPEDQGYAIEKDLIIQAWSQWRPNSKDGTPSALKMPVN
jgi:hypothetical protein